MNTIWFPVTYENLNNYKFYRWNANIGDYGAFQYYKDNQNEISNIPIKLINIGDINICDTTKSYTLLNDISGLNKTTIELPNIPKNTPFGWSHEDNLWLYYTNKTNDKATHYTKYII